MTRKMLQKGEQRTPEEISANNWTRDEMLVAQCIAFLSAERHKIEHPARYAQAFIPSFIGEAKRVLAAFGLSAPLAPAP